MSLVSVIVCSYNSAEFIVETIESIANQTWKELELIITDDCSKDNTVEICTNWLNENRQRFTDSRILTSEENTGVSANANRGLKVANGDWVKYLGADDTLIKSCIEDNVKYINKHAGIRVLFSKVKVFNKNFEASNFLRTLPVEINEQSIISPPRTAESQYRLLLLGDKIHFSPSVFMHRRTLLEIGGFDERYKLQEDYPLWLKLTKNGIKLYFMEKVTVNYRMHSQAINNIEIDYLVNPNYFKQEEFRKRNTYPYLPFDVRMMQRFNYYSSLLFRLKHFNRNNKLNRFILAIISVYMNPFKYAIWIKKSLIRNYRNNEFYFYS